MQRIYAMKCAGVLGAFVLFFTPQMVIAQSSTSDDGLHLPPAAQAVLDSFEKPLHPVIGGVAPSGGMGAGIAYNTPKNEDWFKNVEGRFTVNKYWSVIAETGRQTQRSRLGVIVQSRDMNRLDFFGIGPDSQHENRTDFALRETVAGVSGWIRATNMLRLGASALYYSPAVARGHSSLAPSIEQRFSPAEVPGLASQPNFGRYRAIAEVDYPVKVNANTPTAIEDSYRGTYQLAFEAVRDADRGEYNFNRVETEVLQQFGGFRPGHRFSVHGLAAITNAGSVVPFYLQYSLGGGGGLAAFRTNTIGMDGTKATLRSFHNYRFRDRDILLTQAEYRVPIRHGIHTSVFVDAGRVAPTASDLFGGLKAGTGFSVSYLRNGAPLARLDVGYGSGEGMHFLWSFGGLLQQ